MYVAAYLLHVSAIWRGKITGLRFPYCDRCADCDDISLFYQKLACLMTYLADLGFWYGTTGSKLCDGSMHTCQYCPRQFRISARGALTCPGRSF